MSVQSWSVLRLPYASISEMLSFQFIHEHQMPFWLTFCLLQSARNRGRAASERQLAVLNRVQNQLLAKAFQTMLDSARQKARLRHVIYTTILNCERQHFIAWHQYTTMLKKAKLFFCYSLLRNYQAAFAEWRWLSWSRFKKDPSSRRTDISEELSQSLWSKSLLCKHEKKLWSCVLDFQGSAFNNWMSYFGIFAPETSAKHWNWHRSPWSDLHSQHYWEPRLSWSVVKHRYLAPKLKASRLAVQNVCTRLRLADNIVASNALYILHLWKATATASLISSFVTWKANAVETHVSLESKIYCAPQAVHKIPHGIWLGLQGKAKKRWQKHLLNLHPYWSQQSKNCKHCLRLSLPGLCR